jgi:2-(3-amino-3-carboxypropyl)histidine synthase
MERKLEDVEYNLEIERIVREINKTKAKKVLIQLPDGLKSYAVAIVHELEKRTRSSKESKPEIYIWLGSCFGACDIPKVEGVDLVVQFGHSKWD